MFKILLSLILVSTSVFAKEFTVQLKSGDVIVGNLLNKSFDFKSDFAELSVPVEKVTEISFQKSAVVHFVNEDILTARILNEKISINCEVGKLEIDVEKISRLTTSKLPEENNEMKWVTVDKNFRVGIKADKKVVTRDDTLIVTAELINISKKEAHFPYPIFSDYILGDEQDNTQATVALLASQETEGAMEEVFEEVEMEGFTLAPGARIVIDFILKVKDIHELERMDGDEAVMLDEFSFDRKVKKKLHFKQKLGEYFPKRGANSLQALLRHGPNKRLNVLSPEIQVEYKP